MNSCYKWTFMTSLLNTRTRVTTAAYLHRRDGHCADCSQWCRHMYVCFQMWADRAESNHHYLTDRHSYLRDRNERRQHGDEIVLKISLENYLWREETTADCSCWSSPSLTLLHYCKRTIPNRIENMNIS